MTGPPVIGKREVLDTDTFWFFAPGPEKATNPYGGDNIFFILLLVMFLVIIVIMGMLLEMYHSQLKDTQEAYKAEVNMRKRLTVAYREKVAEGQKLKKKVFDAQAATRKAQVQAVGVPVLPTPQAPVPPPPNAKVSYGDVEAVQQYDPEPEVSGLYSEPTDAELKELDARLGMALGSSVFDEIEEEKKKEIEEAKEAERKEKIRILDVFLLYKDGRLLYHISKKQRLVDQSEQIGAMLTALQMFVKQSLDRERAGAMEELVSGRLSIMMEYGELTNMAVVLEGRGDKMLRAAMKKALDEIHKEHYADLLMWDGRLSKLGGEESIIKKHILGEYEEEEFHMGGGAILDLSGASVFNVGGGKKKK